MLSRFLLALCLLLTACGKNDARLELTDVSSDTAHLAMNLEGQDFNYQLTAVNDLVSPDAVLTVQTGDTITQQPLVLHAYKYASETEKVGVIVDDNNQVVSAFVVKDGEQYAFNKTSEGEFSVMSGVEVPRDILRCGVEEDGHQHVAYPPGAVGEDVARDDGTPERWINCYTGDTVQNAVSVGIALDVGAYQAHGSNLTNVQNFVAQLLLNVNLVYTPQFNVVMKLGNLLVQTTTGGPSWNRLRSTCEEDYGTTLDNFTDWRSANASQPGMNQGLWHLINDCVPLEGGTVGIAWIGVLCNKGYGTGVSGILPWNVPYTWEIVAHEWGHNFGANHTFGVGGIMDYGDGMYNGIYQFHPNNKPEICGLITNRINSCSNASSSDCVTPFAQCWAPIDTTPPPTPGTGTGLRGKYFQGNAFAQLKQVRTDATINFDWGTAAPDPTVPYDNFTVRWEGEVQPHYSETYTFTTVSDDGVRLWINDQQLINDWTVHAPKTNTGTFTMVAGQKYKIVVEYFEYTNTASMKLQWSSQSQALQVIPSTQLYPAVEVQGAGTGLRARYYEGINFDTLKLTRVDQRVYFNWGTYIAPSVPHDYFSVIWEGQIQPLYTETYTFSTISDDGIRVWINNQLIISNWTVHSAQTNSGTISLIAGQKYNIVVNYFDNVGSAIAMLRWSSPSQSFEVVPRSQLYPAP